MPQQWYLNRVRAYDAWTELPPLAPVHVAVIDSGVDLGHPDLAGRIVAARSFVGGTARDRSGHGTMIAGIIAAKADNGIGIAGLAPAAQLLVAKVVERDGTIPVEAEVRAIRWAVARGARVINMSLGGVRDPSNPDHDTYSQLEADAVAFALSRGAVVVAAVGNSDQAPDEPWRFAFYPAALPHVLGVSAVGRDGSVPGYSNRDAVFNDLAAPGADIVSTFPRSLTRQRQACQEQGYSPCATADFRPADGTSFAAPQVSAAAATLLSVRPELRPEQVPTLLERTAVDAHGPTGCRRCGRRQGRVHGLGHARRHGRARRARRAAARGRRARDERRRRRPVAPAVGDLATAAGDGDGGLLGRPGRRLRRVSARRGAGWTPRSTATAATSLWRSGARGRSRCSAWQGQWDRVRALRASRRAASTSASAPTTTGWHYLQVRVVAAGRHGLPARPSCSS